MNVADADAAVYNSVSNQLTCHYNYYCLVLCHVHK
jgi:hypothetical protein